MASDTSGRRPGAKAHVKPFTQIYTSVGVDQRSDQSRPLDLNSYPHITSRNNLSDQATQLADISMAAEPSPAAGAIVAAGEVHDATSTAMIAVGEARTHLPPAEELLAIKKLATQTKAIGIILPPPDIRAIIDKTSQFVAKHGRPRWQCAHALIHASSIERLLLCRRRVREAHLGQREEQRQVQLLGAL